MCSIYTLRQGTEIVQRYRFQGDFPEWLHFYLTNVEEFFIIKKNDEQKE